MQKKLLFLIALLFIFLLIQPMQAQQVKMEKINYGGWPNCIRLSNNKVELVITTDVGPRVIRYGFVGKQNNFGSSCESVHKK